MSTILDQYGMPWKFAHAADTRRTRGPQFPTRTGDLDALIPAGDLATLRSLSNRLYTNLGVLKAAIDQKADYSVGEAYLPKYVGESDFEDGRGIAAFMRKMWFPRCDVRGGIYNWNRLLRLTSIAIDRDGDVFWLLVKGGDNYPRIQQIPAHRVGNAIDHGGKVTTGKFIGRKIVDGVIQTSEGRALAYRVLTGDDMNTFVDVDARDMIHVIDPTAARQSRGLPAFTHALEDMRAAIAATADERMRQGLVSRLHALIYNDSGGPDTDDPFISMNDTTRGGCSTVACEEMPGGVRYMRAGSGEKIEQMRHESPGDMWENFQDRMIRMAISGVKWSYSLVWKSSGQGTSERAEIVKARRAITGRQCDLDYAARRALAWAYSVFEEQGLVPLLDHPFSWEFSRPPRLTVDDGREAKIELEEWRAGLRNTSQITEARYGMTEQEFELSRAHEVARRKVLARQVSEEYTQSSGYEISVEDREMAMLTANEMAPQPQQEQPTKPKEDDDDEDSND